jgi:hypothetical protein
MPGEDATTIEEAAFTTTLVSTYLSTVLGEVAAFPAEALAKDEGLASDAVKDTPGETAAAVAGEREEPGEVGVPEPDTEIAPVTRWKPLAAEAPSESSLSP